MEKDNEKQEQEIIALPSLKEVMDAEDEEMRFAEEDDEVIAKVDANAWKILIIDDDAEVHGVTRLALGDFTFEGKGLQFLSAHSAAEAKVLFRENPDSAVILLDVIMEEEDSGLKLVKYLREELGNTLARIILRTGEPGQAPEGDIIVHYDINDYKSKTELTTQKLFTAMVVALRSFKDLITIEEGKLGLRNLVRAYSRFVPHEFLSFLRKECITEVQLGDQVEQEMTILFSDIRHFTSLSEVMTPQENFNFINSYLSRMEPIIRENNGFIDKYIGDAIMALFPRKPDDGVRAAIHMQRVLEPYNDGRLRAGYKPIQIGVGLHIGKLMLGTVGAHNRMDGTVISDAVNLASRVEGITKVFGAGLLITEETFQRLHEPESFHIRMIDRVPVRGKSEMHRVYEVYDGDPEEIIRLKDESRPMFQEALELYNKGKYREARPLFEEVVGKNKEDKAGVIYLGQCRKLMEFDLM